MPEAATIVKNLLRWYVKKARDLPWRRQSDPYGIWISEIMLQQTQVKTVIPYWERWMKQLPTIARLAAAREDEFLKLWEGLGYYSRVRNIHRAAHVIMDSFGGEFPRDHTSILSLPGIGPYTAGAISSIAFGDPQPIVDGNVIRVLTRVDCVTESTQAAATKTKLWSRSANLVEEAAKGKSTDCNVCGDFNQALMELGATVCLPREPICCECPLARDCYAKAKSVQASLPNVGPRKKAVSRVFMAVVIQRRQSFMVRRRGSEGVNAGLWEFPNTELKEPDVAGDAWLKESLGVERASLGLLGEVKHSITTSRILLRVYKVRVSPDYPAVGGSSQWASRAKLDGLAFTAAHRKIVERILGRE